MLLHSPVCVCSRANQEGVFGCFWFEYNNLFVLFRSRRPKVALTGWWDLLCAVIKHCWFELHHSVSVCEGESPTGNFTVQQIHRLFYVAF